MGFRNKQVKVLSSDFIDDRRKQSQAEVQQGDRDAFLTFATPEGQRTLERIRAMAPDRIVQENVHQTTANAARADLVREIVESVQRGERYMSNE